MSGVEETNASSSSNAEEGSGVESSKSKSGSKTGSKTGSRSGSKTGSKTGSKVGSKIGSKAGSKTSSKTEEGAAPNDLEAPQSQTKSGVGSKKTSSKTKGSRSNGSADVDKGAKKGSRTRVVGDLTQVKIGFVGAGRMSDSITRGFLKSEKITPKQLFVAARSNKNFDPFKAIGIYTSTRPYEIFAKLDCDVVFLCMHGFVIRNCFKMGGTRPFPFTTNYIPWKRKQVSVLSLVGGIPINDIKVTLLNPEQTQKYQVVFHRMMINVSCAYGLGYGVLDVELDSKKCPTIIRDLLQLLGRIEYLDAGHMDAACALAGNGLAFCYYYITALANGGFKMGLSRDRAFKMACKTLQSAALSLLESNMTPIDLRDETTGPSGAALYGMHVMEKKDFSGGVANAVEAAYKRILELVECEPTK